VTAPPIEGSPATTYEIVGPPDTPVVLALGGISSSRHVARWHESEPAGWWEGVVGPASALTADARRILGLDFVDGGRAPDGRPARIVTTIDQARFIVGLLDQLEIDAVDVVGASYGGMVGLALAQEWPRRVRRLVVISAAHESHPMATGLRALQRRIVELGLETDRAVDAMAIARAIAMTTYRTAEEFAARFDVEPHVVDRTAEFDVERYLLHAGEKFAARTPAERFLALSLSADLHLVVPERIDVPVTVIASRGDTLVPAAQTDELARRLPQLRALHTLDTQYGHDAFLLEGSTLGPLLLDALRD
jgi:homoserine O-acetyltransferase